MTKEELKQEAEKHADGIYHYKINVSDYGEDGIINYRYSDVKEAYVAGAEPREKRIAELEKRCANYEMNISKMEKGTCDICKETEKDKKILELEKENAELTGELKDLRESIKDYGAGCYENGLRNGKRKLEEQLTKAKKIIEQLLLLPYANNEEVYANVTSYLDEAEQFLNEVEK